MMNFLKMFRSWTTRAGLLALCLLAALALGGYDGWASHGVPCPGQMYSPANGSPADSATGVPLTPTLTTGLFQIPDFPCTWDATQWVVEEVVSDIPPVYNEVYRSPFSYDDLFTHAVPSGFLKAGTQYSWFIFILHDHDGQPGGVLDNARGARTRFTTESQGGLIPPVGPTLVPLIQSLSPSSGSPGSPVAISGQNFLFFLPPFSEVLFDGQPLSAFVQSATQIQMSIPADAHCGPHAIQVRNNQNPMSINPTYDLSNEVSFIVTQPCQPPGGLLPPVLPGPSPVPVPQIASLSPNSGPPGATIRILGSNFEALLFPNAEALFDGQILTTAVLSAAELEIKIPAGATCGSHKVQVQNGVIGGQPALSNDVTFQVTQPCQGGGAAPAPPGGGHPYDANKNCRLDDAEFFAMVDAWIRQTIDNTAFFEAVDDWIQQSDICVSAAAVSWRRETLSVRATVSGLYVRAPGADLIELFVYDQTGALMDRQRSRGQSLTWQMSLYEKPFANGVYFFRVSYRDGDGRLHASPVRKLLLLR